MNIPEKLTKEEARARLAAIDADPDAVDWNNVRAALASVEAEVAAWPELLRGLPVEKTLAILRAHVAYLDAASESPDLARTAMLAAAHDALAALKRCEAVMAEHERADIGGDLAMPLSFIRATVRGALGMIEGRLPPVERTQEVVLRAMLRAYEAAAFDARVAVWGAPSDAADAACVRAARLAGLCKEVAHDAEMVAGGVRNDHGFRPGGPLAADYEARLRGDRPLDAPPMEV